MAFTSTAIIPALCRDGLLGSSNIQTPEARMQTSAKEALDLSQETKATQEAYGLHASTTESVNGTCAWVLSVLERALR